MIKFILSTLLLSFILIGNSQSLKKLGLIFDKISYNFGDVEQWNNQAASFTFTNKSKQSLTILPLFSENDLDVIIPDRPIKPGETIVIQAMYYTDGKGVFNRKFPIYFGSRAEPIYLRISGNIKSLSPQAYIQCPMAKPELSKPRIELIGDVAEIDTEIPLSGTTIEIIGLQNRKEVTLFSNSKGRFGAKLPTGNYMITVKHPNYVTYTGSIYIGQTSPPLRLRLTPIIDEPLMASYEEIQTREREKERIENLKPKDDNVQNLKPKKDDLAKVAEPREKEHTYSIDKKNDQPDTGEEEKDEVNKVAENINNENLYPEKEPKKNDKLDRDIEYVKNEPKDSPFSGEEEKNGIENVPQTLTTYKENEPVEKNEKAPDTSKDISNKQNDIAEESKDKPVKIKESKKEKDTAPKVEQNNPYTFRVLDKNTSEPIASSSIFLNDYYDKKNRNKGETDERGYSELVIVKSSYRFIATADGYISNEIRISEEDKSDIYKIFLSPVSDLYDEIYEAKKERAKQNEELLNKLSFGKTEFSFAQEEPIKVPETTIDKPTTTEPVLVENNIPNRSKEDSLENIIAQLENANKKDEEIKHQQAIDREIAKEKQREQEKIDSLKNYIDDLQEKNDAYKDDLERVAEVERKKELEQDRIREKEKIDSLTNYINELTAKNDAISEDLKKVAENNKELEDQKKRDNEKLEALESATKEIEEKINSDPFSTKKYAANNIMFLIDVSTSMEKGNKMEMLKTSIKNLTSILRDIDRVAIIAYNQRTNIILESISGDNKSEILNAIDSLQTGGLTNGVKGLTTAYEMLEYYFIPDGNNQIILATDGLFSKYNNEMTETELNRLVRKQAEKDMKLTVVGFGKDEEGKDLMNKLAKNGSGQYIQIKNDYMTKDVLIKEIKLNSVKQ